MKDFLKKLHTDYLMTLDKSKDLDNIGTFLTSHLKVGGAYWTISALACLKISLPQQKQIEIKQWLLSCQNQDGGFGGNTGHDSHITSTHYVILLFILFDSLKELNLENIGNYIKDLQNQDGSFRGSSQDNFETDTRFSYCAFSALKLLNQSHKINIQKGLEYVLKCENIDGGMGGQWEMESHAAYAFCNVGVMKIGGHKVKDDLGYWLSERQTSTGGFNGRPDKLPDVCYSWWILSSLNMMGKQDWINETQLEEYILNCQDSEDGGIADKPGNQVDVFHTFFGLAALSLLDKQNKYGLSRVDPCFALPEDVVTKHFSQV